MKFLRERLGEVVGAAMAPLIARVTEARHARTFHPDGVVFMGKVTSEAESDSAAAELAKRLTGAALVRCSGALWRRGVDKPDVLGVAIRFRAQPDTSTEVLPGDQDVLFATILSPVTMPFSLFTTNATDFSQNTFWAVAPFDVPGLGRCKLRLTPVSNTWHATGSRDERLRDWVNNSKAGWVLEARRTFTTSWAPVARVGLQHEVKVDQASLKFSAFNDGQGIVPRGFVHSIRKVVYEAGQAARAPTNPFARPSAVARAQ